MKQAGLITLAENRYHRYFPSIDAFKSLERHDYENVIKGIVERYSHLDFSLGMIFSEVDYENFTFEFAVRHYYFFLDSSQEPIYLFSQHIRHYHGMEGHIIKYVLYLIDFDIQ